MSEMTSYEPGTPCWVDLGVTRPRRTVAFYAELFGWDVPESENPEQTGGYRLATAARQAGRRADAADAGGPAAGLEHLRLGRGRRRDRRVKATAAGAVPSPRRWTCMDLGTDGGLHRSDRRRLRHLAAGHVHRRRAGQRGRRLRLERAQHPRPGGPKEFYGAVFGWAFEDQEFEGLGTYTTIGVGRRARSAACFDMRGRVPGRGAGPLARLLRGRRHRRRRRQDRGAGWRRERSGPIDIRVGPLRRRP